MVVGLVDAGFVDGRRGGRRGGCAWCVVRGVVKHRCKAHARLAAVTIVKVAFGCTPRFCLPRLPCTLRGQARTPFNAASCRGYVAGSSGRFTWARSIGRWRRSLRAPKTRWTKGSVGPGQMKKSQARLGVCDEAVYPSTQQTYE